MHNPPQSFENIVQRSLSFYFNCFAQIRKIADAGLYNFENIRKIGLLDAAPNCSYAQTVARRQFIYTLTLMEARCFSLIADCETYPVQFSMVSCDIPAQRESSGRRLRQTWEDVQWIEKHAHEPHVQNLANDIRFRLAKPFRVTCMIFERVRFNVCSRPFQRIMRAQLQVLFEEAHVEDAHRDLQDNRRLKKNKRFVRWQRQMTLIRGKSLDKRASTVVQVSKTDFEETFSANANEKLTKRLFESRRHRMDKEWSRNLALRSSITTSSSSKHLNWPRHLPAFTTHPLPPVN